MALLYTPRPFGSTLLLLACTLLLAGALPARDDTGTYRILDYRVELTPDPDGSVRIVCRQEWRVESGAIPWVTVGLPNADFRVLSTPEPHNAAGVNDGSRGSWSGVRITLDRIYTAGETFVVAFTVQQFGLCHAQEGRTRLHYRPGWYDRARIDRLTIRLARLTEGEPQAVRPEPELQRPDHYLWERTDLAPGRSLTIRADYSRFAVAGAKGRSARGRRSASSWIPKLIGFAVLVVILVFVGRSVGGGGYGGGGRLRGGGNSTAIHSCVVSCACACACVSCACACACAGGGAAGCDRKAVHRCAKCGRGAEVEKDTLSG